MKSRTAEGKHTPRFTVEVVREDKSSFRSHNIAGFYATREEAQTAINLNGLPGLVYKVRQK